MDKGTEKLLIYGGIAAVGLYFFMQPTTTVAVPATATAPASTIPAPPASYNQAYYLTYQYPAMVAANPNITNPNYQMTAAEAQQYYNNYTQIQQWSATVIPKPFPTLQAACQYHWKTYGVAQQMSFMPFTPPDIQGWTPPPANANTSGSSSVLSTALKVAATAAPYAAILLGVGAPPQNQLNDADVEILINGGGIALDILPYYYSTPNGATVRETTNKLTALLKQYTA
jgi:hypothetical protein